LWLWLPLALWGRRLACLLLLLHPSFSLLLVAQAFHLCAQSMPHTPVPRLDASCLSTALTSPASGLLCLSPIRLSPLPIAYCPLPLSCTSAFCARHSRHVAHRQPRGPADRTASGMSNCLSFSRKAAASFLAE